MGIENGGSERKESVFASRDHRMGGSVAKRGPGKMKMKSDFSFKLDPIAAPPYFASLGLLKHNGLHLLISQFMPVVSWSLKLESARCLHLHDRDIHSPQKLRPNGEPDTPVLGSIRDDVASLLLPIL